MERRRLNTFASGASSSQSSEAATLEGSTLRGLLVPYGVPSRPMRSSSGLKVVETIAPGAMAESVRDPTNNVRLYLNHVSHLLLASSKAGTLRLTDTPRGVEFVAELPPTVLGREVVALMRRGDIDGGLSWGMRVPSGGDVLTTDGSGTIRRLVKRAALFEGSVLTEDGAYAAAFGTLDNNGLGAVRCRRQSLRLKLLTHGVRQWQC